MILREVRVRVRYNLMKFGPTSSKIWVRKTSLEKIHKTTKVYDARGDRDATKSSDHVRGNVVVDLRSNTARTVRSMAEGKGKMSYPSYLRDDFLK